MSCNWRTNQFFLKLAITLCVSHLLKMMFTPRLGPSCENGAFIIYDGADEDASVLARVCGRRSTWSLTSSTNALYIRLENVNWIKQRHKITFTYKAVGEPTYQIETPIDTPTHGHRRMRRGGGGQGGSCPPKFGQTVGEFRANSGWNSGKARRKNRPEKVTN